MASDSTEPRNDPKATPASPVAVNGRAARSDGVRIILSVFGSALTVAVALAALILTTANDTRRQFDERIELTRRHSDSQFAQLRKDLREVRGDVREVGGEVRALAERVAYLEGLLFPARQPGSRRPPGREARVRPPLPSKSPGPTSVVSLVQCRVGATGRSPLRRPGCTRRPACGARTPRTG